MQGDDGVSYVPADATAAQETAVEETAEDRMSNLDCLCDAAAAVTAVEHYAIMAGVPCPTLGAFCTCCGLYLLYQPCPARVLKKQRNQTGVRHFTRSRRALCVLAQSFAVHGLFAVFHCLSRPFVVLHDGESAEERSTCQQGLGCASVAKPSWQH